MPSSGTSSPRRRASATRRREILDAALSSFAERGYAEVTIDEIRRRSGASIGSIYHHYGSKEGLAAALYVAGLESYQDGLLARVAAARSARSLVRGVVLYHLEWTADHPAWARYLIYMRRAESIAAIEGDIRRINDAMVDAVAPRFRHYVERGEILRLAFPLYKSVLLGPAQEYVGQWLSGEVELAPGKVADALADAAWRSLRA